MIQDGPFAHDYDENDIKKWLEDAYREIHLIDSKHPITICECFGNYYTESAKYCDMLIIDPYPGKINDYLTHVGNMGAKAVQDVLDNKPLLNLLDLHLQLQRIREAGTATVSILSGTVRVVTGGGQ